MKHLFNRQNMPSDKALFKAMENDDSVTLISLLKKGGNVHALSGKSGFFKNMFYETPYAEQSGLLHVAALAGNLLSVKLLLRRGVDVNAVNAEGQTALDYALTNLSHYEDKKEKAGKSISLNFFRSSTKTQRYIESYEAVINTLLDAGATPGLFQLPAKFTPKL